MTDSCHCPIAIHLPQMNVMKARAKSSLRRGTDLDRCASALCGMPDGSRSGGRPSSYYKTKTYYFCSDADKALFDATPDKYVNAEKKQ